jgi:hypothetical protein
MMRSSDERLVPAVQALATRAGVPIRMRRDG